MRFRRSAAFVLLCVLTLLLSGCTKMTETYQKTLYGTTFQPGTPCTSQQVWDGRVCRPKPGGAS